MKISPARTAAFDVLTRIEKERAFSSVLLPEYESSLSLRDRGLCHEIVLGVLRRRIYLDRVTDSLTDAKSLDPAVRNAVRVGLYQLLFLDRIPDHSAINESVNLVQRAKKTSAKGLVNAVLRRAAREPVHIEYTTEIDRIAAESSHPTWLIEKWAGDWGVERASAIAFANNDVPAKAFRATLNGSPDQVTLKLADSGIRPSEFVEDCFLADDISPELRELAADRLIYFQDEASQMVARAVEIPESGRFLDVCASPGSKTTLIASIRRHSNGLIAAGDIHESRVEFLKQNCIQQGATAVSVVQYDAEVALPFAQESFDSVLVDAPCSGTGTIRHNPEIRYFLEKEDFDALSAKQLNIVSNASKLVRKGGNLVYSTCSLEPEENEGVIERFLGSNPEFSIERPNVDDRFLAESDFARTFPDRDRMDGFFIAKLVRI